MSNYFAVGLGLIEHLEAKADEWGVKRVGTVASINKINKNVTPALYVINTGNNPNPNGSIDSRDVQQWTVVVAVSNQAAQDDVKALMQSSGELVSKVINHVQGYQLDDYHDPLERTSTSGRPDYFSTFALYPLTFQTTITP
ncbi:phage tail terminator protein [Psychrobacter sp.]|uniref:phage tail terminator protein n=1 Tax=Psychrobacter sp. TaxID=56811 RepID=UPI003C71E914